MRVILLILSFIVILSNFASCNANLSIKSTKNATQSAVETNTPIYEENSGSKEDLQSDEINSAVNAIKLQSDKCIDPDLNSLKTGVYLMLCNGTIAQGTLKFPAICEQDGEQNCVNVGAFKAADTASFTETDLRASVKVAGLTGTLIVSSPNEWDVRYGVTVGATTGKLKLNCRNMVGDYDNVDGLSNGISGTSDPFSTVDDYNSNMSSVFPTTNPWGSDEFFCGLKDPATATWVRVPTVPATALDQSVFKDKISGMNWSRGGSVGAKNWDVASGGLGNGALEFCESLDHGGIDRWRLPTQKKLQVAYAHGIHDLDDFHSATNNLGDLDLTFWSASTRSTVTTNAWYVNLFDGMTNRIIKTTSFSVLCVSP